MLDLIIHKFADWHGNEIYILREDLLPLACGGNKVRIALKLLADACHKGADTIIGYGNSRSNLCRVLSMLCARQKLGCVIVSPLDECGTYAETTNSRIVQMCGAEVITCGGRDSVSRTIQATIDRIVANGRTPYYINGDSTGHGNEEVLSSAYEEVSSSILDWEIDNRIDFDLIALAVGTGSTFGGLLNGLGIREAKTKLLGFTIAREIGRCKAGIDYFVKSPSFWRTGHILDSVLLGGYGKTSIDLKSFISIVARNHSVFFDSTYAGKALFGLAKYIETENVEGKRMLFVHTGSIPLVFDMIKEDTDETLFG